MLDDIQFEASKKSRPLHKDPLVARILDRLEKYGEDDLLFKSVHEMGPEDVYQRMKLRIKEPDRQKREQMMREEQQIFEKIYGNDPVSYDETGKMIQPAPKWIAKHHDKPRSPAGEDLTRAVEKLVTALPGPLTGDREGSHLKRAVRGFQAGANLFSSMKQRRAPLPLLREDGFFGEKTARRLKRNLLEYGAGKTAEAVALGQMKEIFQSVRKKGLPDVGERMRGVFSPLLPTPRHVLQGFQPEGLALQDTLNDLNEGPMVLLKDDGIIGPKTQEALSLISKQKDDETLMRCFAHNLGFIDLED